MILNSVYEVVVVFVLINVVLLDVCIDDLCMVSTSIVVLGNVQFVKVSTTWGRRE